jgi:predicted aspartyl protease
MAYEYNIKFTPPFPTLPVTLHQVEGEKTTKTSNALVDTGADFTLVPLTHLKRLQAKMLYPTQVRSHWGELTSAYIYMIDLEVAGELLPAIHVVGDRRGKDIILGRNVLNQLILLLDGVHQQSDILTRRPRRL